MVQYAIVATGSVVGGRIRRGPNVPENMENKEDWGVAVVGPGCRLAPESKVAPKEMIDAEEAAKK